MSMFSVPPVTLRLPSAPEPPLPTIMVSQLAVPPVTAKAPLFTAPSSLFESEASMTRALAPTLTKLP